MNNLINCSLDTCNKEYDWTLPGECLLGDLNFCCDDHANIWIARNERQQGKYSVMSKEQVDSILGG